MCRSTGSWMTVLMVAVSFTACTTSPAARSRVYEPGRTLTVAEIKGSGAKNAWEILLRANVTLNLVEDGSGNPAAVSRRRGSGSDPQNTVVILDGAPIPEVAVLRLLPAEMIQSIRIVDKLSDLPLGAPLGRKPSVLIYITTRPRSS